MNQPQPLLADEQYKDVIVHLAFQHLEAVKQGAANANVALSAQKAAESLSAQLKEAQEKLAQPAVNAAEPAEPLPAIDTPAEPASDTAKA